MTNVQQGFPQSAIIADAKGSLTQPWRQFFISLWNRTGAQQGSETSTSGDIKAIAYSTPPGGWLLCDGSAVSRASFASLFDL